MVNNKNADENRNITCDYIADMQSIPGDKRYVLLASPFQMLESVYCTLNSVLYFRRVYRIEEIFFVSYENERDIFPFLQESRSWQESVWFLKNHSFCSTKSWFNEIMIFSTKSWFFQFFYLILFLFFWIAQKKSVSPYVITFAQNHIFTCEQCRTDIS